MTRARVMPFVALEGSITGEHGIGFAKGCDAPVDVGDPYNCGYLIANTEQLDNALATITWHFSSGNFDRYWFHDESASSGMIHAPARARAAEGVHPGRSLKAAIDI